MSDSLEKLVKEIDALTYNARSVMNALNRSAIASSSSNGFTITRAGEKLTLTRPLIYRLSKFYEEWANNSFWIGPPVDVVSADNLKPFDLILRDHDLVPVQYEDPTNSNILTSKTGQTTVALVIHSKILFLTPDNISNSGDSAYWVNLLKTTPNPKLITNSAPIPLNIRTPIFDENLSTTRFLSHENYLFPYAYFALETLGYTGDANNHQLAGLSWEIVADDFIRLMATKISMGGMIPGAFFKTWTARVGDYALAWGYDTNARGKFSTAGGVNTMAIDDNSIAIGSNSISSGLNSIVLGYFNSAPGFNTAVVGGNGNFAIGPNSGVYVGTGNIAGEKVFAWEFSTTTQDVCVIDPVTHLPKSETVTGATNKTQLILKNGNYTTFLNLYDTIMLFDFTTVTSASDTHNLFSEANGNGYKPIIRNITNIQFIDSDPEDPNYGNTIVTIDFPGVEYANVDGGLLSVTFVSSTFLEPGRNSFVTGSNNIASGEEQTVVGKSNKRVSNARFIVGSGSGGSSELDESNRKNSFIVGDDYISGFVTINDDINSDTSFGFKFDPTKSIIRNGRSKVEINDTLSQLSLYQSNASPPGNESAMLFDTGKIVIYAQKEAELTSETLLTLTSVIDTNINTNGILTITSGNTVINSGPLTLNWSSLSLNGPTYNSLPTTDKQYSHIVNTSGSIPTAASLIPKTGFYALDNWAADFTTPGPGRSLPIEAGAQGAPFGKYWLLNITNKEPASNTQAERLETWQMVFGRQFGVPITTDNTASRGLSDDISVVPGSAQDHKTTGNICVRRTYSGSDINGLGGRFTEWRPLAWLDDVTTNSLVVHTTGDQTITGSKNFVDGIFERNRNDASGSWTLYPPTISHANPLTVISTLTGYVSIIGKTAFLYIDLVFNPGAGGDTNITIGYPATVTAPALLGFNAPWLDNLGNLLMIVPSTNSFHITVPGGSHPAGLHAIRVMLTLMTN